MITELADICGWPDEPGRDAPPSFIERMSSIEHRIAAVSGVRVDAVNELTDRARLNGWSRDGARSVGGSCHLLATADNEVAVNLARHDDHALIAAVLGIDRREGMVRVPDLARAVAPMESDELLRLFADTGTPITRLGETVLTTDDALDPVRRTVIDADPSPRVRSFDGSSATAPVVVDLSSLWAGPLCSRILARAGFDVVKVESAHRPDSARRGHPDFFARLNEGKRELTVDFTSATGIRRLISLVESADVVIEASRPRALEHLGIIATEVLRRARPRVWLSITGHGRDGVHGRRVGFGDDCAVAGGLVTRGERGVAFFGDAAADPITGLLAAAAVLEAWAEPDGRPVLLDAALARSAAWAGLPGTRA